MKNSNEYEQQPQEDEQQDQLLQDIFKNCMNNADHADHHLINSDLLEDELRSDEEHPGSLIGGKNSSERGISQSYNERMVNSRGFSPLEDEDSVVDMMNSGANKIPKHKNKQRYYELDEGGSSLLHDISFSGQNMTSISQSKWRAKLYQLNHQGSWDDYGTGEFSLIKDKIDGEYYMQLINEVDKETELLRMKISSSSSLQRQRGISQYYQFLTDTIITWLYDKDMIDFALSFQDSKGAQETWDSICIIQGKDPNEGYQTEQQLEEDELPPPTFENISQIVEELQSNLDIIRKRKISSLLVAENCQYLRRIQNLFEKAEELDAQEYLFYMFHFFKALLSLNDTKLIETLLSKDFFMVTLGALEYDPEVIQGQSPSNQNRRNSDVNEFQNQDQNLQQQGQILKHREFLTNELKFKQVVKIEDDQILDSIHLAYRLTYLKDTAIARFIDDQVLSNINSLIYVKSQDIVNHIFYNKEILVELLQKMRSHSDLAVKHDAIEFFMEVCQLSKNLQLNARFSYFETINSFNLIEILAETFNIYRPDAKTLKAEALKDQDNLIDQLMHNKEITMFQQSQEKVKQYIQDFLKFHDKYDIKKIDLLKINSIEILMNIITQAPSISIRAFILSDEQKREGYPFIKRLAYHVLYSFEQGIKIQVFEFMKALLDNENSDKKVEFTDLFYKEILNIFLSFLTQDEDLSLQDQPLESYNQSLEYNRSLEYSRSLVIQIFIKCASEHAFRFRIFAVQAEVIEKISRLTRFRSKLLNLWIIKFYKALIKVKDDAFVMYLMKKTLLKTVVDIFLENPNKSNMLHSTILELFDYLTKENNRKIAAHLLSNYSDTLFKVPKYEVYFRGFVEQYDEKLGKSVSGQKAFRIGANYTYMQRENLRKQDEDLINFGERSNSFKVGIEDDEKYNQEMYMKRKQDLERNQHSNNSAGNYGANFPSLLKKRRSSNGEYSSSEEEDDDINDMGLFGNNLTKYKQQQKDRGIQSPQKDANSANSSGTSSPAGSALSPLSRVFNRANNSNNSSRNLIQFELSTDFIGGDPNKQQNQNQSNNGDSIKSFLMDQNEFVKGGVMINSVTGQTSDDRLESFSELEKQVTYSKRPKSDVSMDSCQNSQSQSYSQYQNSETNQQQNVQINQKQSDTDMRNDTE
ncbi:UNKNOWN [Stylonychia lemnae]|uniref:Serine/threonine-protein phosphatase 4 regulatory subunit 3-like central domain-containing protein n=1 Tax=Stylonychia lemnae TaxID=5949 RepID=A0A078B0Q2_STYLE|nr:UNKNOWN [Stylonychia lemnae]|eukprot:CDW88124.1 UNKNOWN [Stylonychia lemnae]